MRNLLAVSCMLAVLGVGRFATASVDTLQDTSEVREAVVYSYEWCNPEITGEDCRRYNGGGLTNMPLGKNSGINDTRIMMQFPGLGDTLPDSAELQVYCYLESDALDRDLYLYPLTSAFIEGSESGYAIGDYPNPDSGVTWNHAYLDDGDHDSLNWQSAGGDFTIAVACTTTITGTGSYFSFPHFERILTYFDTSGTAYGVVIVNANAVPTVTARKVLKSSEAGPGYAPLLIQYFGEDANLRGRRRRMANPNR